MFGYIKTRPYASKTLNRNKRVCNEHRERANCDNSFNTNSYLSWRTFYYFFNSNSSINVSTRSPKQGLVLPETLQVDLCVNKPVNTVSPMADTMEYTVTSYDTLPKIALKFNITPSELSRLNKLVIRTLYPGQVLKVPVLSTDTTCLECSNISEIPQRPPKSQNMAHNENESAEQCCREPIAKRVSFEDIDEEVLETFIKVKSKYITDGEGVVKGILLITPQSLIFHPDVSEILVVDKGVEYYQCNLPMDSICAAGMFDDIAEMFVHDTLQPGHFVLDKPLMKWIGESNYFEDENVTTESSDSTLHPSLSTDDDSFVITDMSTSDNITTDNTDLQNPIEQSPCGQETTENPEHEIPEVENQVDINKQTTVLSASSHEGIKEDQLEQLTHVTMDTHMLHSTPKMSPFKEGNLTDINDHGYSEGLSRDSGIDDHFSGDNIPRDLSLDGTLHHGDGTKQPAFDSSVIIPRLSTCHVDMPKFLCIKIKKACWHSFRPLISEHLHEVIQKANDERREYWFSIPCARLFDVYAFFMEKCPAIHDGESDEEQLGVEGDFVGSCGSDYSIIGIPDDEELKLVDDFFSQSPGSEHIMLQTKTAQKTKKNRSKKSKKHKAEVKTRRISSWSVCSNEEIIAPEIDGESEILTEKNIIQLSGNLPSRTVGHVWRLIYSTSVHGISLKTLYRCMADYDNPTLLVIKDETQNVFGAFASSPLQCSDHFYGTGECFLFTFSPHYRIFRWSGENNFFIKGDLDSLAFGGGQGNFGLWLDEDLYRGSSHSCKTFNNEPLTVTEDFLCSAVELWCF